MQKKTEGNNKKLALEAFHTLFNKRDYSPGYFAIYFTDPDGLKFEFAYVPGHKDS